MVLLALLSSLLGTTVENVNLWRKSQSIIQRGSTNEKDEGESQNLTNWWAIKMYGENIWDQILSDYHSIYSLNFVLSITQVG